MTQLARLCQRGENDYVGVQCGIMDQSAVACGRPGQALLLDCRSLEVRPVALPIREHVLVVCRHRTSRGGSRRPSTTCAVRSASRRSRRSPQVEPGVAVAARRRRRRCSHGTPPASAGRLGARRARRRARTPGSCATVEALETGDLVAVGRLFAESHASLRDRFEVSSPELDAMVEIADRDPGRRGGADDRRRVRWLHGEPRAARRGRRVPGGGRARIPRTDRARAACPGRRTGCRSGPGIFGIGGSLECAALRQGGSGG